MDIGTAKVCLERDRVAVQVERLQLGVCTHDVPYQRLAVVLGIVRRQATIRICQRAWFVVQKLEDHFDCAFLVCSLAEIVEVDTRTLDVSKDSVWVVRLELELESMRDEILLLRLWLTGNGRRRIDCFAVRSQRRREFGEKEVHELSIESGFTDGEHDVKLVECVRSGLFAHCCG